MRTKLVCMLLACLCCGCTDQERARHYGGTATITLPMNEKLVVVTWKGDDLWFLTLTARPGEKPESYAFRESSSWGVFEGTIRIQEELFGLDIQVTPVEGKVKGIAP